VNSGRRPRGPRNSRYLDAGRGRRQRQGVRGFRDRGRHPGVVHGQVLRDERGGHLLRVPPRHGRGQLVHSHVESAFCRHVNHAPSCPVPVAPNTRLNVGADSEAESAPANEERVLGGRSMKPIRRPRDAYSSVKRSIPLSRQVAA
jgi:hypothetical protein